jgi:hypothetical protein
MLILFTCEHCGKRIKVDARMEGRRGRCSNCGHEMRIPRAHEPQPPPLPGAAPVRAADHARTPAHEPAHAGQPHAHVPAAEPAFRLSPPEARPEAAIPVIREQQATSQHAPPILTEPEHLHRHVDPEALSEFELLVDDHKPGSDALASPEVQRGLRELEEFKKDPRAYQLAEELDDRFFRWARGSGPAGWIYTQWRKCVGLILRALRFIDDWAYLISIPFLVLMIFGVAIAHRGLVHTGAVVVVLANYGRFWTDLLALFVRPFKEGPVHGVLFLFPPYAFCFIGKHWDKFKSTFRRLLTSCIPIVLVVLAYAFIPTIDPDIQAEPTIPGKLRRAEQEIVKEAEEGLHEAGEKLQSLEKSGLGRAGEEIVKKAKAGLDEAGEKLRSLDKKDVPPPKAE